MIVHKPLFTMRSCSSSFMCFGIMVLIRWCSLEMPRLFWWTLSVCLRSADALRDCDRLYNGLYRRLGRAELDLCHVTCFRLEKRRPERSSVLHSWASNASLCWCSTARLLFRVSLCGPDVFSGVCVSLEVCVFRREAQCLYACLHNVRLSCCWVDGDLVYAGMCVCVCERVSVRQVQF